jgi:hypothetical protein
VPVLSSDAHEGLYYESARVSGSPTLYRPLWPFVRMHEHPTPYTDAHKGLVYTVRDKRGRG